MVRSLGFVVWMSMTVASALAIAPQKAGAQDPAQRAEARQLFEEGLALAQVDRWAEALTAFRRSAELVPRASTSYNIANALYRLDRPVQALSELDQYDDMLEVRQDPEARRRGDTLRQLVESAVAVLHVEVHPEASMLFVDGRPWVLLGVERPLLLDPGAHSLRVTHEGYQSYRREIQVDRGSNQSLSIELQPLASSAEPTRAPGLSASAATTLQVEPAQPAVPVSTKDDRQRFVKRPGFWVLIGVIAAAGVSAGVAVAVTRNNDSSSCGTTGDCATTQGLTVSSF